MNPFKLLLLSTLTSLIPLANALPEDRSQSIEIEANQAENNDKTGLMTYQGQVVIRQGSIVIEADRVDILSRHNKAHSIISTGTPASYQQQPETEGGPLIAKGNSIEYLLAEDRVMLKGNASLMRDGTLIKGDSIEYDLKAETWNARGNTTGEQKRIQLVIPPARQEGDGNTASQQVETR